VQPSKKLGGFLLRFRESETQQFLLLFDGILSL